MRVSPHPQPGGRSRIAPRSYPTLTFAALVLMLWPPAITQCLAGPNSSGALVLALCEGWCYSDYDIEDYCGLSTLADCESGLAQIDSYQTFIWYAYAAFPEGSLPRLSGLTFGIDYELGNEEVVLLAFGGCGDFELPDSDWPAPGAGTAVTFSEVQQGRFTEVYWFAGYDYYGVDTSFDLVPHPNHGGLFADDSIPSELDPILDYGRLGFFGESGYLPCPPPLPTGACCVDDGCVVSSLPVCESLGGSYVGDSVPCEPDPCTVPIHHRSWGQIKGQYRGE